jgi:hypothetical protein
MCSHGGQFADVRQGYWRGEPSLAWGTYRREFRRTVRLSLTKEGVSSSSLLAPTPSFCQSDASSRRLVSGRSGSLSIGNCLRRWGTTPVDGCGDRRKDQDNRHRLVRPHSRAAWCRSGARSRSAQPEVAAPSPTGTAVLDASWLGQVESLWADDHATDDEYHYLRNAERHEANDERCQCGHQRHHEQAL